VVRAIVHDPKEALNKWDVSMAKTA